MHAVKRPGPTFSGTVDGSTIHVAIRSWARSGPTWSGYRTRRTPLENSFGSGAFSSSPGPRERQPPLDNIMAIPNRGPELAGVNISFLATAVIANTLRCFVRVKMVKAFGIDDYLMVAATVSRYPSLLGQTSLTPARSSSLGTPFLPQSEPRMVLVVTTMISRPGKSRRHETAGSIAISSIAAR